MPLTTTGRAKVRDGSPGLGTEKCSRVVQDPNTHSWLWRGLIAFISSPSSPSLLCPHSVALYVTAMQMASQTFPLLSALRWVMRSYRPGARTEFRQL